jgi:hypothetical protein
MVNVLNLTPVPTHVADPADHLTKYLAEFKDKPTPQTPGVSPVAAIGSVSE